MDKPYEEIRTAWLAAFLEMALSPGFHRFQGGDLSVDQYASILTEIYYHLRERSRALAAMAGLLADGDERVTALIERQALAETGRDQTILRDLEALGGDATAIENGRPLPITTAVLGYMDRLLQRPEPSGFLGYLLHVEWMRSHAANAILESLERSGVPSDARGFISKAAEMHGIEHPQLELYVEHCITSENHLALAIEAAVGTARLYGVMVEDAVQRVDRRSGAASACAVRAESPALQDSPRLRALRDASARHKGLN